MSDEQLYIEIHRLFRELQRRNKFVHDDPGSGLNLIESHLLLEVDAAGELSISEITIILGVDQSIVSRTVKQLVFHGLLISKKASDDQRVRKIKLTKKGQSAAVKIDKLANQVINSGLHLLDDSNINNLYKLFKEIADGFHQAKVKPRKSEHKIRCEQRRITRAFNLLGDNAYDSGLNSSQYLLLMDIAASPIATISTELVNKFAIAANTCSGIINKLIKLAYIEKIKSKDDKRKFFISATNKGFAIAEKLEKQAAAKIKKAISINNKKKLQKYLSTLRTFVRGADYKLIGNLGSLSITELNTIRELSENRTLLFELSIDLNQHKYLPALLLDSSQKVFKLYSNEKTLGIIQFDIAERSVNLSAAAWSKELTRSQLKSFIKICSNSEQIKALKRPVAVTFKPLSN